jgi:ferredoxin-type protein NapG
MDRREFFRRGISKVAEQAVQNMDKKVTAKASHWIRPPYAKSELEFLLSCTRCNACIDACPHQVIFPLSSSASIEVKNTPALDLLNSGCHLCTEWPCVTACDTGALALLDELQQKIKNNQERETSDLPRLAKASIDTQKCLPYNGPECGACASLCVVEGALTWESYRPIINMDLCTGCALCREVCITDPKAINISSL